MNNPDIFSASSKAPPPLLRKSRIMPSTFCATSFSNSSFHVITGIAAFLAIEIVIKLGQKNIAERFFQFLIEQDSRAGIGLPDLDHVADRAISA